MEGSLTTNINILSSPTPVDAYDDVREIEVKCDKVETFILGK